MTAEELLSRRIDDLAGRLLVVEARLASVYAEPDDCRAHACTYYHHYLAEGPAELAHEGFHAAERRCEEAQDKCTAYHLAHPNAPEDGSSFCCRQAERWEKAVRA